MRPMCLNQLLPANAAARLLAFRRDVALALPGAVDDVILFGSRARGDAQADSDNDVAVLLSGGLADDRTIRRRVYDMASDHHFDGTIIQAVPLNTEELKSVQTELATRILAEGVAIR